MTRPNQSGQSWRHVHWRWLSSQHDYVTLQFRSLTHHLRQTQSSLWSFEVFKWFIILPQCLLSITTTTTTCRQMQSCHCTLHALRRYQRVSWRGVQMAEEHTDDCLSIRDVTWQLRMKSRRMELQKFGRTYVIFCWLQQKYHRLPLHRPLCRRQVFVGFWY